MKNIRLIPERAKKLSTMIDRFSAPIRQGKTESCDLASLARRILATPQQAQAFLARGLLVPVSTLHRGGDSGPWVFESDDLNDLRKLVLAEVVEKVIDQSGDNGDEMQLAASHALTAHRAEHDKPAPADKEFSARVSAGGAILLDRYNGRNDDEDSNVLGTVAKGAAVAGAGLAGTFALGHYQAYQMAKQIAAKHGQPAADAFMKNIGAGNKLQAGWNAIKAGTARAAGSVLPGDAGAAATNYANTTSTGAFRNLRRAGGPASTQVDPQAYSGAQEDMVPGVAKVAGAVSPIAEDAAGAVAPIAEDAVGSGLGGAFAKAAATAGEGALSGATAPSLAAIALRRIRQAAIAAGEIL